MKKLIIIPTAVYFFFSLIFYFITETKPINFIFEKIFNSDISFLMEKKTETIEKYINLLNDQYFYFLPTFPLFIIVLFSIIYSKKILFAKNFLLIEKQDTDISHINKINLNYLIALAAGLGLYLELMIIRLHSSFFQLFAYFKNISLLSCLLGLGVGYLFGHKKLYSLKWVFPLLTVQVSLMYLLKNTYFGMLLQNPITEQWQMGLLNANGIFQFFIIYTFIILIFLSNAVIFVPLGHLVSRLMLQQDKLQSYSWNLIGSISGIILFSFLSFIWSPPAIWLLVGFLIYIIFIKKNLTSILFPFISLLLLLVIILIPKNINKQELYSPYQVISLEHSNNPSTPVEVLVNNTWYQIPYDLSERVEWESHLLPLWGNYAAPYKVVSEIPEKVLIVGSGTGNDVAYALQSGVKKIDAVEIDPVIIQIGKKYHPQKPYQSKKVNIIQNDARNFIQHTKEKYDLIIYGLLDSHSSLSSRGGIRLDSYVYTVESFKEAKKILKQNGYISLTFNLSTQELGVKIYQMLEEAFDKNKPLVLAEKGGKKFVPQPYTFVIGKNKYKKFHLSKPNLIKNVFEDDQNSFNIDKSTDDWPFFYMPSKIWPKSYVFIIFLIFVSSFLFIQTTSPISKKNFSPTCFFLGSGFMLIETKGITELALVFGSTWFVVSIVITCILIMAYFANLLIIKGIQIKVWLIYTLILFTICLGYFFTFLDYGTFDSITQKILAPAMLTIPIFFSGLAFSKQLSVEKTVSVALSSNILGAIVGGLLEYNSMYFGFRSLYILGFLMYFAAFLFSKESLIKKKYKL